MSVRKAIIVTAVLLAIPAALSAQEPAYLTTNPYLGTPIPETDSRVSPYSPFGARNPYTTDGGRIYGQDGQYLGRLNANPYDPESVANPYGRYGSEYSPNSINNPYGRYGSEYSSQSARNPYSTTPPVVIYRQRAAPSPRSTKGSRPTLGTVPRYCNPYLADCP